MTTEERLEQMAVTLGRIDERLKALPCEDHSTRLTAVSQKLTGLCMNGAEARGYHKGVVWMVALIAGVGGSAVVRLIAWALTKM
jgi:hypothetical protein